MKDLLEFLIKNITGSEDFTIREELEDGRTVFYVDADPEIVGLIIGKEGKTIKNIRRIVAVVAARENTSISISVSETLQSE